MNTQQSFLFGSETEIFLLFSDYCAFCCEPKKTSYYLLSNFIKFLPLSRIQFNTRRYYRKLIEFDRRKVIRLYPRIVVIYT